MSNWRLRSPDAFPPEFLAALRAAYRNYLQVGWHDGESEEFEILRRPTRKPTANQADKFNCFRWCLRHYLNHPLARVESELQVCLRIRPLGDVANPSEYSLRVFVRKPKSDAPLLAALADSDS